MTLLPKEYGCTYADYAAWDTQEKYELFDGTPVMQARPSIIHQWVEAELLTALKNFLRDKPCQVFSEIEVLLPENPLQNANAVQNVFVPDIVIICDPEKIKKQHCFGAPTVIMEILSPSTAKADRFVKMLKYQDAGVPEYWIVSPVEKTITVFTREHDIYITRAVYNSKDTQAEVFSLPGCQLDLSKIFPQDILE